VGRVRTQRVWGIGPARASWATLDPPASRASGLHGCRMRRDSRVARGNPPGSRARRARPTGPIGGGQDTYACLSGRSRGPWATGARGLGEA
jgi:hypothetical protein